MKGAPNADLRDVTNVRLQRGSNKLFGIDQGEKWSGCKLLIDFLDQLFNENISTDAKLDKQVRGIVEDHLISADIPSIGSSGMSQGMAYSCHF